MALTNSPQSYGWVTVVMHWVVAVVIIGLFALGYWMVGLSYYDPWYKTGPDVHRSIGILLFIAMLARLAWRVLTPSPNPVPGHRRWEVSAAHAAHWLLYLLIFVAMISGYLISTADGTAIQVFDWFDVPSLTGRVQGMEDSAGIVHYWSTWSLIVLAGVHALAALKHHFVDRDPTLTRMLGRR